jgi:D-alanine transaminase
MSIVYFNNNYIDDTKANINIGDRAYLFGDGIYEAFLYTNGKFIDFDRHIKRLNNSLELTKIKNFNISKNELKDISKKLIIKNNVAQNEQKGVYFYISRDIQFPREHNYSKNNKPFFVAFLIDTPPCNNRLNGLKLKSFEDIRWKLRSAKTTMLMANVMIKHDSINEGYDDGLFVENGIIRESSASNIFFLDDKNEFITPKSDGTILAGVTRWRVIQILKKQGAIIKECDILYKNIINYKGAFLSASISRLKPISLIDDIKYNNIDERIKKIILDYENYK